MSASLPNLGQLRHQIETATPLERARATYFHLELLPYSLGATYQALLDFVAAEREVIRAAEATGAGIKAIQAVGAGGRDKLAYRIDSFMEAGRRTQNAIIPYISKTLSVTLPSSLDDLVKRLQGRNPPELPAKIAADLVGYWTNHGKMLKAYRDLSQHYTLVASEVRLFPGEDGEPLIYITLASNPEERNPADLIFDNPEVHAYRYMLEQMQWLIRFCHEITTALVVPPEGNVRAVSATIMFRTSLQFGPGVKMTGQRLVSVDDVQQTIQNFVAGLGRI